MKPSERIMELMDVIIAGKVAGKMSVGVNMCDIRLTAIMSYLDEQHNEKEV